MISVPEEMAREGAREPSFRASARQLALVLLMVSMGALFLAAIVAHLITHGGGHRGQRTELPLWWALGGGTVLVACASLCLHLACRAMPRNALSAAGRYLDGAFLAGAGFLLVQGWGWFVLATRVDATSPAALTALTFYMLTGLHAAHVLGGLVPLAVVAVRARRAAYSSSLWEPIALCALYWHFIAAVWLVLVTVILLV